MKILIAGASGFIGKNLLIYIIQKGHIVIPIQRSEIYQPTKYLSEKLEGADVVINLTGAPILKRWTKIYKKTIYQSRINTTRNIVNAINLCQTKPHLFISASAIGIYSTIGHHDEESTSLAINFLGTVCKDWETEALQATCNRIVIPRIGVVLSATGGAFPKMYLPFKMGLGGNISSGIQPFSFIHLQDLLLALMFIIENKSVTGVVNMVAPESTTNKEFTKSLSRLSNKPAIFTTPAFLIKMLYGEGATVILDGQNVIPYKLLRAGFDFRFKTIEEVLKEILK